MRTINIANDAYNLNLLYLVPTVFRSKYSVVAPYLYWCYLEPRAITSTFLKVLHFSGQKVKDQGHWISFCLFHIYVHNSNTDDPWCSTPTQHWASGSEAISATWTPSRGSNIKLTRNYMVSRLKVTTTGSISACLRGHKWHGLAPRLGAV